MSDDNKFGRSIRRDYPKVINDITKSLPKFVHALKLDFNLAQVENVLLINN